MRGEFKVTIRLGNSAMSDRDDVAHALIQLAEIVDFQGVAHFGHSRTIFDGNGQRVGQAEFTQEEE